jgi:DNA-binding NarL/FixJ family response regulator
LNLDPERIIVYLSLSSQGLRVFLSKFLSLRSAGHTPRGQGILDKAETLRVDHGIVDEHMNFKIVSSTKTRSDCFV